MWRTPLAVILRGPQVGQVVQAAAYLEGARRCVVFVLDQCLASERLTQHGPAVLGRCRHERAHMAHSLKGMSSRRKSASSSPLVAIGDAWHFVGTFIRIVCMTTWLPRVAGLDGPVYRAIVDQLADAIRRGSKVHYFR